MIAMILLALQGPTADSLIERLGSDDIEVREEAALQLRRAGPCARPALIAALDSKDAEIAARAGDLLQAIDRAGRRVRLWRLETADSDEVAGVLRRLVPEVTTDARTNSVIAAGTPVELEVLGKVIEELDRPSGVRTYIVRGCSDAVTVAELLQKLLAPPGR